MTVLSIDPGRSAKPSIGWCLFEKDGTEIARGEMDWKGLVQSFGYLVYYLGGDLTFKDRVLTRIVIEDFVNDPRVKRGGQRNGASEVIGAVEILADMNHIEFVRRDRSTLTAAKMHAGYTQTLKHLPHADAAYVHGYSDFVERGIRPALGVGATL
jgi:hypothetical protein